jgi:hypothetical protein
MGGGIGDFFEGQVETLRKFLAYVPEFDPEKYSAAEAQLFLRSYVPPSGVWHKEAHFASALEFMRKNYCDLPPRHFQTIYELYMESRKVEQ